MLNGSSLPGQQGPEPPRALAIVVACVVGVMAVGGILLVVNLLN